MVFFNFVDKTVVYFAAFYFISYILKVLFIDSLFRFTNTFIASEIMRLLG